MHTYQKIPKGKWFCPECRKKRKDNTERKYLKHFCGLTFQDQTLKNDQQTRKICWFLLTTCLSFSHHFVEPIIKGSRPQISFA